MRRFREALQILPKKTPNRDKTIEAQAVAQYDEFFHVEKQIQKAADNLHLSGKDRYEYIRNERQNKNKPLIEKFSSWLVETNGQAKGKSHLSEAIQYFCNNKDKLTFFLENGQVPLDNNICERAIRPFTVIRN